MQFLTVGGTTDYGIIVNNRSATEYNNFASSPTSSGISISNITLTGFRIAGIFFNNVIESTSLAIPTNNITNVVSHDNQGSGIVLQNSKEVEVSYSTVYNNANTGISLFLSDNNNITGNNIDNNGINGVQINSSNNNQITNNSASWTSGTQTNMGSI